MRRLSPLALVVVTVVAPAAAGMVPNAARHSPNPSRGTVVPSSATTAPTSYSPTPMQQQLGKITLPGLGDFYIPS